MSPERAVLYDQISQEPKLRLQFLVPVIGQQSLMPVVSLAVSAWFTPHEFAAAGSACSSLETDSSVVSRAELNCPARKAPRFSSRRSISLVRIRYCSVTLWFSYCFI